MGGQMQESRVRRVPHQILAGSLAAGQRSGAGKHRPDRFQLIFYSRRIGIGQAESYELMPRSGMRAAPAELQNRGARSVRDLKRVDQVATFFAKGVKRNIMQHTVRYHYQSVPANSVSNWFENGLVKLCQMFVGGPLELAKMFINIARAIIDFFDLKVNRRKHPLDLSPGCETANYLQRAAGGDKC